jgi:hypothetical protein
MSQHNISEHIGASRALEGGGGKGVMASLLFYDEIYLKASHNSARALILLTVLPLQKT